MSMIERNTTSLTSSPQNIIIIIQIGTMNNEFNVFLYATVLVKIQISLFLYSLGAKVLYLKTRQNRSNQNE